MQTSVMRYIVAIVIIFKNHLAYPLLPNTNDRDNHYYSQYYYYDYKIITVLDRLHLYRIDCYI